jgi:hypothetical protein
MATLLTGEHKLLASKQIYSGVVDGATITHTLRLYGRVSNSKMSDVHTETDETTYYLKFTMYRNKGDMTVGGATSELNGVKKTFSYEKFGAGEKIIQEANFTIKHNKDGTVSNKSVTASWDATIGGSGSLTVTLSFLDFPKVEIVEAARKDATVRVSKFADKGQVLEGIGWRIATEPTFTDYESIDGDLEQTITNLLPETTYYVRAYARTDVYGVYSPIESFTTKKNNVVQLRVNGNWKESIPYIYKNGWKEVTPYVNVNGTYKEVN